MELDAHYLDPRLVELYDVDNPRGADTDFYLRLAHRLRANRIVDLGCGTGMLTRELALPGRSVIGVDPSPVMLAHARRQPGAEKVRWLQGDSKSLGAIDADLAIMTGNVAQVFLDHEWWEGTLDDLRCALRPGGALAFETRNPQARAWLEWNRESTYERVESRHGPIKRWLEVVGERAGLVRFVGHNVFVQTGEDVVVESTLRFRSAQEVRKSLRACGSLWRRSMATGTRRHLLLQVTSWCS